MGWKKTFKNKDGSYDTFDWSLGTEFKIDGLTIITMLLGISLFCAIGPIICIIMYPWPGTRSSTKGLVLAAMIMSVVWVIDYQFGIFNWFVWHAFPDAYFIITVINVTILFYSTLIFFMEDRVWAMVTESGYPLLVTYGLSGFLIYKSYPIVSDIVSNLFTVSNAGIW